MGNRGNIKVTSEHGSVYLYAHWKGSNLPTIVQTAMRSQSARGRWDDEQYLARILFCHLLPKDDWEGETGYGIGTVIGDGDDKVVEVDVGKQRVLVTLPGLVGEWTFNAFVHEDTKFQIAD